MNLVDIINEIPNNRSEFTSYFRSQMQNIIDSSEINHSTQRYLNDQLIDEGMTRYYRFSTTVTNQLKGFGFQMDKDQETELAYGMSLMLFWIRLADRVIDSSNNKPQIINKVYDYLNEINERLCSENPLIDSLYFATKLLRNQAEKEEYFKNLIFSLQEMTDVMLNEIVEVNDIRLYCNLREDVGIKCTDVIFSVIPNYISNQNEVVFERYREFFYEQAMAGMHLDTLVDFSKDYSAGIAPKPTFSNKMIVAGKMLRRIGKAISHLPPLGGGTIRAISYSAVSAYQISRDSATNG